MNTPGCPGCGTSCSSPQLAVLGGNSNNGAAGHEVRKLSDATLRQGGRRGHRGSNTCRRKWTWTFCPPAAVGGGRSARLERLVTAWSLAQPFKSGRGYIMGRGKVHKLQIALPPENRT